MSPLSLRASIHPIQWNITTLTWSLEGVPQRNAFIIVEVNRPSQGLLIAFDEVKCILTPFEEIMPFIIRLLFDVRN